MWQRTLARGGIVVFALLTAGIGGFMIAAGDVSDADALWRAESELRSDPTDDRLRNLLNLEADGGYSYLKRALVGRAFAEHPELFRSVRLSVRTDREAASISELARLGALSFYQYPELMPDKFEEQLRNAEWLRE